MAKSNKISVTECCTYYRIDARFVQQLDEYGLIELNRSGKQTFISHTQLPDLEKYIRLHYELEINMPGMEAISHLLRRMNSLQAEVKRLQNQLTDLDD